MEPANIEITKAAIKSQIKRHSKDDKKPTITEHIVRITVLKAEGVLSLEV